jgi:hypothetical protein
VSQCLYPSCESYALLDPYSQATRTAAVRYQTSPASPTCQNHRLLKSALCKRQCSLRTIWCRSCTEPCHPALRVMVRYHRWSPLNGKTFTSLSSWMRCSPLCRLWLFSPWSCPSPLVLLCPLPPSILHLFYSFISALCKHLRPLFRNLKQDSRLFIVYFLRSPTGAPPLSLCHDTRILTLSKFLSHLQLLSRNPTKIHRFLH